MTDILKIVIPAGATTFLGLLTWYLKNTVEFKKEERKALQLLMRDLFLEKYDSVKTPEDYDYIDRIYKTYKALGGNGYITEKYNKLIRR